MSAAVLTAAPVSDDIDDDKVRSNIVYLKDVKVDFDGFVALNIREFAVHFNELRVVIGPNGAGKTTLCDVISGKTRVTQGRVFFDLHETTKMSDVQISKAGVGRKFQTPTVFDSITVYENMELALPGRQGVFRNLWSKETSAERDRIMAILKRVHLS